MTQPPDGSPSDQTGPGEHPAPGWLRPPPPPVSPPPIGAAGGPPPSWPTPPPEPGWTTTPPPPTPPTAGPAVGAPAPLPLDESTTVTRRSNRALLAAGLVAVLGGIGFAAVSLSSSGGSDSPEAAVSGMIESLNDEDLIGVLESLRPAERDAMRGPIEESVSELERLDLLADVDLTGIQGVDIELEGYQLLTTQLADGVTAVTVTGGTVTGGATPQELPIGGTLREILEDDLDVELPEGTEEETEDLGEFQLVAVQDGGTWYVSPGYSIAEAARQAAEAPLPPFDDSVVPVGGESPEASVRALAQAAVDLDAEAAITQLDPEEMAALYDYAPLFLDDADEAAAEAQGDTEVSFELTDLAVEDGPGGTKRVLVQGFDLSVEYDSEYDDGSYEMSFDGECFSYEMESTYYYDSFDDYESTEDEGDESGTESETESDSGEWCEGEPMLDEDGEEIVMPSIDAAFDQFALVTVERDGRWYVAPTRSVLSVIPTALAGVESSDIEEMREWFRDFWEGDVFFGTEMEFEEVGEAIDGDEGMFEEIDPGFDDPVEPCWDAYYEYPGFDDAIHELASDDRQHYLGERAFQACIADLVATGVLTEEEAANDYPFYQDGCWAAYEALPPDASAEQWETADGEVVACYDGEALPPDDEETDVVPDDLNPFDEEVDIEATIAELVATGMAEEEAECLVNGLVEAFGDDRALELNDASEELTDEEQAVMTDLTIECLGIGEVAPPTLVD